MKRTLRDHTLKILIIAMILILSCMIVSCNTKEDTANDSTDNDSWIDSITDEQGNYIGQDKEVIGYYKRIGIAKIDSTYDDMLKLRDIEKQGYLVVNDDNTAYFELDGVRTEYVFDASNFYLSDDKDRVNGFRYTCINTRLIINDKTYLTQYLRLTDEELEAYLDSKKDK